MSTLNLATVDKITTTNLNTTNLIVEDNFSFKRMSGANFLSPVTDSINTINSDISNLTNSVDNKINTAKNALENQINTLNTKVNSMQGLPVPSTQDNGKFLIVVNGVPTWTDVLDAEEVAV